MAMGSGQVLRKRLRLYAVDVYRALVRSVRGLPEKCALRERAKACLKGAIGEAVQWSSGLAVEAGFRAGVTRVQAAWLHAGLPWVGALDY